MTNWAVVVGINHYDYLSPQEHLQFAASDAAQVKQFLCEQAGFREDFVILCSDTSPPVAGLSTRPSRPNLRQILRRISHEPQARETDQAWFFFSGHGLQSSSHQNYMLTCDGVPDDLEETALSVDFVIQQLIHCKSKNTVLVLDMCRNEVASGSKGSGKLNEAHLVQQAQQNGIITIFSCSRGGKSYELPDLQQGAFTHAFLEGLQRHTILRQLDQYLCDRVHNLTKTKQPPQVPLIVPEPGWKYDRPLLPYCATKADIDTLKNQAVQAWIVEKNLDLAKQLWEIVNDLATDLQDKKLSRESLAKIVQEQQGVLAEYLWQGGNQNLELEEGYNDLRNLLAAQRWGEADIATLGLMLAVMEREEGWLDEESINTFPCEDLHTIDQLWVKHSNGLFGFSVQKGIYLKCGGKPDHRLEDKVWEQFGETVGWRTKRSWHYYYDLIYDGQAPMGHFPVLAHLQCWYAVESGDEAIGWVPTHIALIMKRVIRCNI